MNWPDHITTLDGQPTIRGTRLTVPLLLDHLARGQTDEHILAEHPELTPTDLEACRAWARAQRAEARRGRMVIHRSRLGEEGDPQRIFGAEAISLLTRLTRESWHLAGLPWPDYTRAETPFRFVGFGR